MGSSKPLRSSETRFRTAGSSNSSNGTQQISLSSKNLRKEENKVPKSALTPISRLKKFQKVRDRNLRKQVLGKEVLKKQLKMMEEEVAPDNPVVVIVKEKVKKNESSIKNEENGLNGIEEEDEMVAINGIENGHEEEATVRRRTRSRGGEKETEEEIRVEKKEEFREEKEEEQSEVKEEDNEEDLKVEEEDTEETEQEEEERPLKILRRSMRHSPGESSSVKRSTPQPDLGEGSSRPKREVSFDHTSFQNNSYSRISGRKSLWGRPQTPYKRKAEEEPERSSSKKMAFTPSVSSPGWRFFSSPFTRFWPSTPISVNRSDSMCVNLSTDSEQTGTESVTNLSQSDDEFIDVETIEIPVAEPPQPAKSSWNCSIM